MRFLFLLLPALMMAQTSAPQSSAAAPKRRTATPATRKSTTAGKPKAPAAKLTPMTDDEKTIYALGLSIYRSLSQFDLSPAELNMVKQALTDAAANKPAVELSTWGPKIQALSEARTARVAEREKAGSKAYLEKAAAEPGAMKTESGLVYRETRAGSGASPKATDTVKVNYRGTLVNGTEFDSSYSRNEPAQFPLNHVIPC